jgi:hypothetical protein
MKLKLGRRNAQPLPGEVRNRLLPAQALSGKRAVHVEAIKGIAVPPKTMYLEQMDDLVSMIREGPLRRRLAQVPHEMDNRLDTPVEIREMKLLIGRVKAIIGQAKAHQNGLYPQNLLKRGDNGDRTATADQNRFLAKSQGIRA